MSQSFILFIKDGENFMADFFLDVRIDAQASYTKIQDDIKELETLINGNPPRITVGLNIDQNTINNFRNEISNIQTQIGNMGRVTIGSTNGSNISGDIERVASSTQSAISAVQTMRAELNSVNSERIQQAIASINGISPQGASALTQSLNEANVRATEVRARLLEAADAEQQLVALQVRGTNEMGHMVNYLMTYNTETGEISRRTTDITARISDASAVESNRITTVREINDLYRQMLSLMRTNTNANNISTYTNLVSQAELFNQALTLAQTESISVNEALNRLGLSGSAAIDGARNAMSAFRLEMEQTGSSGVISMNSMYSTIAQMQNLLNSNGGYANLSTYANLQTQISLLSEAMRIAGSESLPLEEGLRRVGLSGSTAIEEAKTAMSAFRAEMSGATAEEQRLSVGTEGYRVAMTKVNNLLVQVRANTEKWTAAKHGKSSESYKTYASQEGELERLANRLSQGTLTARQFRDEFNRIQLTTSNTGTAIKQAGEDTQTWTSRIKGLTEKFSTWFSITRVVMAAYRVVRQMVESVIELDTAMTELKKVTDETDATYDRFLTNATTRAKELGATISDVVTASADFARLGFRIEEAEKLADAAIVYKNVGDGIDDISIASESIIASMQAFGIEAKDVMTIVDKFNEVGNNYAISSVGVGEALLRSAAAMKSANNTLDETIALATAANTIVQDPEKVGTTLKTVSMYLRASKTDAEEAGEATDGMANSMSELRDEILALTGNKVDIQIDEDTYKSTYQILKELSGVWGELTDISQANILELSGGKRNSNVLAAILENFEVAEEALATSADSAGSALAENEKYLESIEGRLSQFKATFQELSNTVINGDFVKSIVNAGTNLLNFLNLIGKFISALGGLRTILTAVGATLLVLKTDSIITGVTKLISRFGKLGTGLQKVQRAMAVYKAMTIASKNASAGALAVYGQSTTALGRMSAAFNAVGISASTAQIAVAAFMIVVTAITLIAQAANKAKEAVEEHRKELIQAGEQASETSNNISTLTNDYLALSEEVKTNKDVTEQLANKQEELRKELGLTKTELDDLIKKYGSATAALREYAVEELKKSERDLRPAVDAAEDVLLDTKLPTNFFSKEFKRDIEYYGIDYNGEASQEALRAYKALVEAGFDIKHTYADMSWESQYWDKFTVESEHDINTVEGLIAAYEEYGEMLDVVGDEAGSQNVIYEFLHERYNALSEAVSGYENAVGNLNDNLAEQYMLTQLSGNELPKTQGEFDQFRQGLIDTASASGEFVGSEKDIEDSIDNVLSKQTQFVGFYADATDSANEAGDSIEKLSNKIASLDKVSGVGNAMNSIVAALNEGEGVSYENITKLSSALEDAGIASDEYIDKILDAEGDIDDIQEVFDELTNKIIDNAIATGDLTVEDEKLLASWLESIGVSNASAVAAERLAYQKEYLKYTTGEYKDKTYEEINALYGEAEAGSVTHQVLARVALEKLTVNGNEIHTSSDVDQLIALANSANATSASLENLAKAKQLLADAEAYNQTSLDYQKIGDGRNYQLYRVKAQSAWLQAQKILDQPIEYDEVDPNKFKVTGTGNGSGSGGSQDANLEAWNNLVKEKKHLVEMDKMTQEEYYDWLASAYKSHLKDTEKYADEIMAIEEELYGWEKEKIQSHIDDEKALLDYKRTKGEISEEEYFAKIKELYDDGYGELQKAIEEKGLYGSNTTARLQAETEFLEEVKQAHNDAFEAERQALEHKLAMNLISEEQYLIELQRLYDEYYAGNEMYSEEATEIEEELYDLRVELVEKWADAAAEAIEEMTEAAEASIEAIQQLIQDSIDTHEENFDLEKGLLDHALAMNYISEEEYYNSLEDLYKSYFKDKNMYTEQYWENQEEVYQHEQAMLEDSASAIEDIHAKVVEMIKQELEDAVSAIEETKEKYLDLIEIRREALSDLKDEEDYEKERAEQLSTISELQRQLNALSHDTSAAGVAKYKEVYAELQEAQKALEDMENERAYDVMNDQLDDEEKSIEVKYDAKISEYEDLANDNEYLVEEAWARLSDKNSNLYNELMEYNKKYSTSIKDDITGSWETATKALESYASAKAGYESINGQIGQSGMSDAEYSEFQKITQGKQIYNWASTALDFGSSMLEIGAGLMGGMMSLAGGLIGGPFGTMLSLGGGLVGTFAGLGSSILKVAGSFATGTDHVPKKGWYRTNELGDEINLVKDSSGNEYRLLTEGSRVIDAESTARLMKVVSNPSLLADWARDGILSGKSGSIDSVVDSSVKEVTVAPVFQINSDNPEGVANEIRKMLPEIAKYTVKNILSGAGNTGTKQKVQHLYK